MRFRNGFTQFMAVALLAVLLVFAQPYSGQAAMTNSTDQQEMSSTDPSMEKMPDMTNKTVKKEHPEDQGGHSASGESGHNVGEQGVNWPLVSGFAGVNGAVLLTAAFLKRSKLKREEVEI